MQCTSVINAYDKQEDSKALSLRIDNAEEFPSHNGPESSQRFFLKSLQLAHLQESQWLGRMVQAFLSCVTTGNVKV